MGKTFVQRSRAGGLLAAAVLAAGVGGCTAAPATQAPSGTQAASPTTGTFARPTRSATSSPTGIERSALTWQQIATLEISGQIVGIAGSAAGYLVVAWPLTAWFSADGRTWTQATLPFTAGMSHGVRLKAYANAVVGGQGGFLVVGGADVAPCAAHMSPGGPPRCNVDPISWTSADGRSWRSSAGTPVPADGSELPVYTEFTGAWPAGDGWDAALTDLRDGMVTRGNTQLHSSDGVTWARLGALPLPDGSASSDDIYAHGGVAAPDGRRLAWQVTDLELPTTTTLSTSTDGAVWTRVTGFEGTDAVLLLGVAPAQEGDPWLLGGYRQAAAGLQGRWWASTDLATWQTGPLAAAWGERQYLRSLGRWAGQYVALGARQKVCCPGTPGTWISADGRTWLDAGGPDGPMAAAPGPAGLVGIRPGEDGESSIWIAAGPVN